MLKLIEFTNFRGFRKKVSLQVRPITVLIGKNNAGKSTFFKLLNMLRQTIEEAGESFFSTEGRHTQLGDFSTLQNLRSQRGFFSMRIEGERRDTLPRALLSQAKHSVLESADSVRFQIEMLKDQPAVSPITRMQYAVDVEAPYSRVVKTGYQRLMVTDGKTPLVDTDKQSLHNARFLYFTPRSLSSPKDIFRFLDLNQFLPFVRADILRLRHIGPLRIDASRVAAISEPPSNSVGANGEYTIPMLASLAAPFHPNKRWASQRLRFIQDSLARIAGVSKVQVEMLYDTLATTATGTNALTRVNHFLADFGTGVGQVLPVLVQGAVMHEGDTLLVEQPESQLHPTAQLEVGTALVQLWHRFHVPSIIETHSENIVLRLRTLVREAQLNPNDVSIAWVSTSKSGDPQLQQIEIESNGGLKPGLPMSFFGQDIAEALKLTL